VQPIRLLSAGADAQGARLAAHVRRLQEAGPVLFVTADRPLGSWLQAWREAGVDQARLVVIDAVSAMNGQQPAHRPANATFLPSPAMLEMLLLRIEQLIVRHAPARVVVDSVNTLALYNGVAAVQSFAHYLANRLRGHGIGAELVLCDAPDGALLRERLAPFADAHAPLEALP
jgi:KaiC/GvpD/RAD55 family RecA-like ATPase